MYYVKKVILELELIQPCAKRVDVWFRIFLNKRSTKFNHVLNMITYGDENLQKAKENSMRSK